MPSNRTQSYLRDIHDAILAIQSCVSRMDLATYEKDSRTQAAVERKLMVISEAAIRLADEAEALCPVIPWRDIRGIGNWLRHQYDRVDGKMVWNTVQDDLPALKEAVLRALDHPPTSP